MNAPFLSGTINACELCDYRFKSNNKFFEKQDHLVEIHFKEKIQNLFPRQCGPYICPYEECSFEGLNMQDFFKHYSNSWCCTLVIEKCLKEAFEEKRKKHIFNANTNHSTENINNSEFIDLLNQEAENQKAFEKGELNILRSLIPGIDEKNSELDVVLNAICYIHVLVDELRPTVSEHLMKAADNTEISKTIFQESKFQSEFSKQMESLEVVSGSLHFKKWNFDKS